MPPETFTWDRKEFYRDRNHERSSEPRHYSHPQSHFHPYPHRGGGGGVGYGGRINGGGPRWREHNFFPNSHHHPYPQTNDHHPLPRWGSDARCRQGPSGMSNPQSGSKQFALRRSPRLLAMSIPESGSSHFATRRSARLLDKSALRKNSPMLGKSATTKPKRISPRKPRISVSKRTYGLFTLGRGRPGPCLKTFKRDCRKFESKQFRQYHTYENCNEEKTCIYPGGQFSWSVNSSSGITWVAVHGRHSLCAVFKRDLDKDRLRSCSQMNIPSMAYKLAGLSVISEIEDLADLPSGLCPTFPHPVPVKKSFAVVSVIPSTTDKHSQQDLSDAIKFLEGRIESGVGLDCEETIQTAISAFQRVCRQEFKSHDEIWVAVTHTGMDIDSPSCIIDEYLAIINGPSRADENDGQGGSGGSGSDSDIHLQTVEIKKHLAVINDPDSGGSGG